MLCMLRHPIMEKEIDSGEGDQLKYGVATMQGWRVTMEDAHSCILKYQGKFSYFAVYDGHGGSEVSQYTAEKFPKFLLQTPTWNGGRVEDALREGFVGFDASLIQDDVAKELKTLHEASRKKHKPREDGSDADDVPTSMVVGSTACVALIDDTTIYVANAGDSRCVLSRGGRAVELSHDHKPLDRIEKRRIKHAGAHVSANGRLNYCLNLSRAMGDHYMKQNADLPLSEQALTPEPDVRIEKRQANDEFLVLACDGIWECKDSQEVIDFVRERLTKGMKPTAICEKLCDACVGATMDDSTGGFDNMTVIIVVFKQNEQPDASKHSDGHQADMHL